MKMETELTAAVAGTVAAIHVKDGQLVGQGDALVDIAPDRRVNPREGPFICTANSCRSQMAEAWARHLFPAAGRSPAGAC